MCSDRTALKKSTSVSCWSKGVAAGEEHTPMKSEFWKNWKNAVRMEKIQPQKREKDSYVFTIQITKKSHILFRSLCSTNRETFSKENRLLPPSPFNVIRLAHVSKASWDPSRNCHHW